MCNCYVLALKPKVVTVQQKPIYSFCLNPEVVKIATLLQNQRAYVIMIKQTQETHQTWGLRQWAPLFCLITQHEFLRCPAEGVFVSGKILYKLI